MKANYWITVPTKVFVYPFSHWQSHKPVDVSLMTNVSFFTLAFGFFLSQTFSKLLERL